MPNPTAPRRNWFFAVFGLPFLGVGVGMLAFLIVPALHDARRASTWPETQGWLQRAELISSTSKNSTTYRVEAEYSYVVNGRQYHGSRVALDDNADNIGDFQQTLGNALVAAYQKEQPVRVWYDPANPKDALLNRDIRWGLVGFEAIFVVVFGGAGLGFVYAGLRAPKPATFATPSIPLPHMAKPVAVLANFPQSRKWQSNVISSGGKTGLYLTWGFTVVWNAISLPLLYFFKDITHNAGGESYFILIFPFFGVLLLYWAVTATLEWRRFGETPLTLWPFPGEIGGNVGGEIAVNVALDPNAVYRITLACLHSYVTGSGDKRSTHEREVWQAQSVAAVERTMKGIKLKFSFQVPAGLPESEPHSSDYRLWRISVVGEMAGIDLNRSFEIPVMQRAGSSLPESEAVA